MDDQQPKCDVSELVEKYYALLYRYAYRLSGSAVEAEDLTQQTFLTAQSKIDQLRDPQCVKSWLFTIVHNTFLKKIRSSGTLSTLSLESVIEPADKVAVESPLIHQKLQTILNELPEEFRTPLILYYFEEFSYKQIAEQIDVPIGTVMSRLARAKKHLRYRLTTVQPVAPE
ncbi:MAG: sigma-70 family RNA polymerase sigma factor [Planctomycetes bacterium]|nr:sigma-70 family RNA polymerase sigma factor [Planctomycetota bacterium]